MRRPLVVVSVAAISAAAVSAAPVATAGDRPHARAAATTVSVSGKEYKFTLSRTGARHGRITFRFTNKGRLKHDFRIDGKKTRILRKGKSQSITVSLKKGRYSYLCTVPGHKAAGMKGTFRVT